MPPFAFFISLSLLHPPLPPPPPPTPFSLPEEASRLFTLSTQRLECHSAPLPSPPPLNLHYSVSPADPPRHSSLFPHRHFIYYPRLLTADVRARGRDVRTTFRFKLFAASRSGARRSDALSDARSGAIRRDAKPRARSTDSLCTPPRSSQSPTFSRRTNRAENHPVDLGAGFLPESISLTRRAIFELYSLKSLKYRVNYPPPSC